ncbi:MAG: hypothetical protein ACKOFW_20195, partial [Planctomycetaceae bacterium]
PTDLRGLFQVLEQQLMAGHTVLVFDQHPALRQIADVRYVVQCSADPATPQRMELVHVFAACE